VTQPRTDEAPVPPAARGGGGGARRSVTAALLLGLAGATIVLLAKGRIWMNGTVDIGAGGVRSVSATGQQVGGLPGSLALVAMAAFVAVFAVRGAGRVALAGLLVLCGAGTVVAALSSVDDPSAMNAAAATATALVHATVSEHTTTAWPLLSAGGGALVLAAGIIALVRGRAWPAMSSRYDREGAEPAMRRQRKPVVDPDRPEDLWKALDRGEDPTEAG
jgi:uncharacterized membrane protein (TIGR02234 family)